MIKKPYFVILNNQKEGVYLPLMEGDGKTLAVFETELCAEVAAFDNPLGKNLGFEVFELGGGVVYIDKPVLEKSDNDRS